jgi:hypothetical protein
MMEHIVTDRMLHCIGYAWLLARLNLDQIPLTDLVVVILTLR